MGNSCSSACDADVAKHEHHRGGNTPARDRMPQMAPLGPSVAGSPTSATNPLLALPQLVLPPPTPTGTIAGGCRFDASGRSAKSLTPFHPDPLLEWSSDAGGGGGSLQNTSAATTAGAMSAVGGDVASSGGSATGTQSAAAAAAGPGLAAAGGGRILEDGSERLEGRALRWAIKHRSQSPRLTGIRMDEPSAEERRDRLGRAQGMAYVHGVTAALDQFTPDPVPKAGVERSVRLCMQWRLDDAATTGGFDSLGDSGNRRVRV